MILDFSGVAGLGFGHVSHVGLPRVKFLRLSSRGRGSPFVSSPATSRAGAYAKLGVVKGADIAPAKMKNLLEGSL